MNNEELTTALGEDVFACLDRFFDIASERGVKSVTLDCRTRKVNVEMTEHQEIGADDPEEFYYALLDSYNVEDRVRGIFCMWKRRQFIAPTAALYQRFIGKQLEALLRSDFFVLDEWWPTEPTAKYEEELKLWGLDGKDYEQNYALLRQMMSLDNNRLIVDEAVAGRYIETRHEKLTQEGMKCFFCFVRLCKLVYAEMDSLEGEKSELSSSDKALLARLLEYAKQGDWQKPATYINVCQWISVLFGADLKRLDTADIEQARLFREFFKSGRGGANADRAEVSMANVIGYLKRHHLIAGGQQQISHDVFGNADQVGNINKGHDGQASQAFARLEAFMDKYREKIIG